MPSGFELRRISDPTLDDLQARVKAELDRQSDRIDAQESKKLQFYGVHVLGRNGAGYIAIPAVRSAQNRVLRNVREGDEVVIAVDMSTGIDYLASFETVVKKADSLRQLATANLSLVSIFFEFVRSI